MRNYKLDFRRGFHSLVLTMAVETFDEGRLSKPCDVSQTAFTGSHTTDTFPAILSSKRVPASREEEKGCLDIKLYKRSQEIDSYLLTSFAFAVSHLMTSNTCVYI